MFSRLWCSQYEGFPLLCYPKDSDPGGSNVGVSWGPLVFAWLRLPCFQIVNWGCVKIGDPKVVVFLLVCTHNTHTHNYSNLPRCLVFKTASRVLLEMKLKAKICHYPDPVCFCSLLLLRGLHSESALFPSGRWRVWD